MQHNNLLTQENRHLVLKGRDLMNITFELIILAICMIGYTIYAVWQMTKFKKLSTGIIGATCLSAGSVGVYLAAPFVAAFLMGVLKLILIIGVIAIIISILGG